GHRATHLLRREPVCPQKTRKGTLVSKTTRKVRKVRKVRPRPKRGLAGFASGLKGPKSKRKPPTA
ncbi:MAG: hypothetical protein KAI47_17480, partial [Deltaproteobacteria bacterium]|nr:hypothetical protein [Deltaproteobacteria bacterium]